MSAENITDQATATAALNKQREDLNSAVNQSSAATDALRRIIVEIRPVGVLTVADMADAIDRDRNYVDSVWSSYGETTKGKQTRVSADASDMTEDERSDAYNRARKQLADAAKYQRTTASDVTKARAERDRVVALVYASKILGPSAIAAAVDVDRNHVLRIARKSKVAPVWRPAGTARNQHTKAAA